MSASEQQFFLTLSEREYSCGTASGSDNKLIVTNLLLVPGKDFDDSVAELKDAAKGSKSLMVQASMPFSLVSVPNACDPAALLSLAHNASGFESEDISLADAPLSSGKTLAVFSKKEIAQRAGQASQIGAEKVRLFCRGLSVISSIKARLQKGSLDKPVLYVDIQPAQSRLFVVGSETVSDLGIVDSGTDQILEQVMAALGLKFPGSAAKLFYGDLYDFDEHAEKLVAPLSERIASLCAKAQPAPAYLYASGLPASRTVLLCAKMADALKLAPAPIKVSLEAQGTSIPSYISDSFIGISTLITSDGKAAGLVDLSQPALDAAAILSAPSASTPAPAASQAPKSQAAADAKPAAPASKVESKDAKPVQAAAPSPAPVKEAPKAADKGADAKPAQAPLPKAEDKNAQKPSPSQPAKADASKAAPAAKQPDVKKPEPQKPTAKLEDKKVKKPVPPEPQGGNGKKVIIFGGIAAAIVIIAAVAVLMGKGEKAPAKPTAPVVVQEPDPAPEPVAPVEETAVEETPVDDGAVVENTEIAEPEPEEPPAPTTGSLSIQTTPIDAQIYIDGELKGTTPAILNDLPVGTCAVELRKENYESQTLTVEIVGGQTEGLNGIVLAILHGSIDISSSPIDIPYTVTPVSQGAGTDDPSTLEGVTPFKVEGLKPGTYNVSFNRPGWKTYDFEIDVRPGQTSLTAFDYQPGSANIVSSPAGASVISGGNTLGVTPLELDELPEGIFEATLQLDGYEPETVKLDIPFGGSASSESTMLPLDRLIKRATDLDTLPSRPEGATISIPASVLGNNGGRIYIRFVIAADGSVENASMVSASMWGDEATAKVLNAVRSWTFTPGTRKGFPMRVEVVMPVNIVSE